MPIKVLNVRIPNNMGSKHIKKLVVQGGKGKSLIVYNFNTSFSANKKTSFRERHIHNSP